MDWENLPITEIMDSIKLETEPIKALNDVIKLGSEKLPSLIWAEYKNLNIKDDVTEATNWIQKSIDKFPKSKGIYLGLDTLNMNEGEGTNIEIGFSEQCNPKEFDSEWIYDCENYGDGHLIKGLYNVSDSFNNEGKYSENERRFAEYMIFLGYSGIVLREALLKVEIGKNFLSIWGFSDGDMFFLVQKKGKKRIVVTDIEIASE